MSSEEPLEKRKSSSEPEVVNAEEDSKVHILSYNIFVRPPGIKTNASDYKDARLKLFLEKEIDQWDIIAFQELFGSYSSKQKNFIRKARERHGFKYHVKSPSPSVFSKRLVDGGLVIISKYPIISKDFKVFPEGMDSDALACKGVLYAKVELRKNCAVHIFNTHLQASYNNPKALKIAAKYEKVRKVQLQTLRDFMYGKLEQDNSPVILLGDFNVDARPEIAKDTENKDAVDVEKEDVEKEDDEKDVKHSDEYKKMLDAISNEDFTMVDLLYEHQQCHPPTVGDVIKVNGEEIPKEIHLTSSTDQKLQKRLDYIFWIKRKDNIPFHGSSPNGGGSNASEASDIAPSERLVLESSDQLGSDLEISESSFTSTPERQREKVDEKDKQKSLDIVSIETEPSGNGKEEKEERDDEEKNPSKDDKKKVSEDSEEKVSKEDKKGAREDGKQEEGSKENKGEEMNWKVEVADNSCEVKEMLCKGQTFTQLSDHYGVCCTLLVKKT